MNLFPSALPAAGRSCVAAATVVVATMPFHFAPAHATVEIVVRLRPSANVTRLTSPAHAATFALRGHVIDGLPIDLPIDLPWAMPRARRAPTPFDFDPARTWLLAATDSSGTDSLLAVLERHPEVVWAERVVPREAAVERLEAVARASPSATGQGFPNDPLFVAGRQWGLANPGDAVPLGGLEAADIGALAAWRHSVGNEHVLLAIADTGIDPGHPEFHDAAGNSRITAAINITGDTDRSFGDRYGHGTPVSGVMAATTGDGAHFDSLGIAGVCGGDGGDNIGCRIIPIKITRGSESSATSIDIARAILYAADSGARALNVSFTGNTPSRLEREALHYAITRGCVVVAAAGNRGVSAPRAPQYPAAYAADGLCVQVGASDAWDQRAVFSSYGPGLDLLAPGVGIWTTFLTYPSAAGARYDGYVSGSGTSFAAPFVTGTIGLLAAACKTLTDNDFQHLLRLGARDLGAQGVDETTGFGRLDAAASLALAGGDTEVWHDEVAAAVWIDRDVDSLVVLESGFGALAPGTHIARRIEARATVAVPDSFLPGWRVWPRVGGTTTVRGDFRLPHWAPAAAVVARDAHTFTLAGWSYRVALAGGGTMDVPLPPDQLRFGFTVIGPVARTASVPPAQGLRGGTGVLCAPNPFRDRTTVAAARGAVVECFDLTGRRVRRIAAGGSVEPMPWNGDDDRGHPLPAGVYLVRAAGGPCTRVVKLE